MTFDDRIEIGTHIRAAADYDIPLTPNDFTKIDGEWTIDGMNPAEWLDAMTMD